MSINPSRSANVSMLVLSSRIGVWDIRGPGLDLAEALACSLCCQQYNLSSLGSSARSFPYFVRGGGGSESVANGRRHGRPPEVMPRHVVEGFLESERLIKDSGVLAMKGMVK